MFGAILKATNSSFQKGMTFCRSIYVKKVMKLRAFIFEQPSYFPMDFLSIVISDVKHFAIQFRYFIWHILGQGKVLNTIDYVKSREMHFLLND